MSLKIIVFPQHSLLTNLPQEPMFDEKPRSFRASTLRLRWEISCVILTTATWSLKVLAYKGICPNTYTLTTWYYAQGVRTLLKVRLIQGVSNWQCLHHLLLKAIQHLQLGSLLVLVHARDQRTITHVGGLWWLDVVHTVSVLIGSPFPQTFQAKSRKMNPCPIPQGVVTWKIYMD
jgi:hypothetical protein